MVKRAAIAVTALVVSGLLVWLMRDEPEAPLTQSGGPNSIVGAVFDPDGTPCVDAEVVAWIPGQHLDEPYPRADDLVAGIVDKEGRYQVLTSSPGTYQVLARSPRFAPRCELAPAGSELDLPLGPGLVAAGTVVDERGDPVANARVKVELAEVRTDSEGRFELHAMRNFPLEVHAEGYAVGLLISPCLPRRDLRVVLGRGRDISIPVRYADDGEPVVGTCYSAFDGIRLHTGVTDGAGRIVLKHVPDPAPPGPPLQPTVLVWGGRHAPKRSFAESFDGFVVEVERGITVRGHVVDRDGHPVAQARVCWMFGGSWNEVVKQPEVFSADDGSFELHHVPRSARGVTAFHRVFDGGADLGSYALRDEPLAPGATVDVVVKPSPPGTMQVIDDDGRPVARARVDVEQRGSGIRAILCGVPTTYWTDASGRATLAWLPARGIEFTCSATGSGRVRAWLGGGPPPLLIRLPAGQVVRVRVVSETGEPIGGASVIHGPSRRLLGPSPVVGEDGRIELRDIPPGEVDLRFYHRDYGLVCAEFEIGSSAEAHDLGDVALPACETITGVVADSRGQPVPRTLVSFKLTGDAGRLFNPDADGWSRKVVLTDGQGRFAARGMCRGTYSIECVAGPVEPSTVNSGKDVTIRLRDR